MTNNRWWYPCVVWAMAIAIAWGCAIAPGAVFAQDEEPATVPIVLEGRRLFEVSASGEYSASERAEDANEVLNKKVNVDVETSINVTIEEKDDLPVIEINGDHLLSVTLDDVPQGGDLREQAEEWRMTIEDAIKQARRERTREYIGEALLKGLACALFAWMVSVSLGWLWQRWRRLLTQRNPSDSNSQALEIGARILLSALRVSLALLVVMYIAYLFPQTRQLSHNIANALLLSLTSGLFPLGGKSFSVLDLLRLIGLFSLLLLGARIFKRVLRSRVLQLTGLSRAAQETIAIISTYTFIFIGTIVVLQLWGLELSSLTVFAGVLGVGIGLGVQGIAKEFISGLVIIFERPVQVGDFVDIGGLVGTVEHISVRSTTILTPDRISVILPNSRFLESEVINWSHRSPISRLKVAVGVAYGSPLETVKEALLEAAKEHQDVLSQPPPSVFFTGFGDSSLDFELMVWIVEPPKQFRIKSELYFLIDAKFRDRAIEIPFPQRDLNIRSGQVPLELSPQLLDSLTHLSHNLAQWLEQQTSSNGTIEYNSAVRQEERNR